MSTQANSDARTITIELDSVDQLDDLEWALSMARHQMTKRARETDVRRNPQRRADVRDAREAFLELQDIVGDAKVREIIDGDN